MGWAELNQYESELSALQKTLADYQSQLKIQEDRLEELERMESDLDVISSNYSYDISSTMESLKTKLEDAMQGISTVESLLETVDSTKEKDVYSDTNLSTTNDYHKAEITATLGKIEELKNNISKTETAIATCEANIKREKHNIAQGYYNDYTSACGSVNSAKSALDADPDNETLKSNYDSAVSRKNSAWSTYKKYESWM